MSILVYLALWTYATISKNKVFRSEISGQKVYIYFLLLELPNCSRIVVTMYLTKDFWGQGTLEWKEGGNRGESLKVILNGVVLLMKVRGHRIKNTVFTNKKFYMPSPSVNSGLHRKYCKWSQLRNFYHSFILLKILWPNLLEILLSCRNYLLPEWSF